MTLTELLPGIPKKSAERYARILSQAGLITPTSLGEGRAFDYSESDSSVVITFVRYIRQEGLSAEKALRLLAPDHTGSLRIEPDHVNRIDPAHAGSDRLTPVSDPKVIAELADERAARAEAETIAKIEQQKREEAERLAVESARHAAAEEKRRRETEIAADLDRRNMLARISRLETAMTEKPKGIFKRMRAAWDVLTGRRSAPLCLPAPREREEGETLQKAA